MDAEAPRAFKIPKAGERMTYRQELDAIKSMPKLSRLIVILKVAGVVFFAIGLEGIVSGRWALAVSFLGLGLFVSLLPIQVRLRLCARCGRKLDLGQAICPRCGVPNM
jgi:hypothetical protein